MYTKLLYIILFCIIFFLVFFIINRKIQSAIISLLTFLLGFNIAFNEIIPGSYVLGAVSNYRMFQVHVVDLVVLVVGFLSVLSLLERNKHVFSISILKKFFVFDKNIKIASFFLLIKRNIWVVLIFISIVLQLMLSIFLHKDIVSIVWTARFLIYFVCIIVTSDCLKALSSIQKKSLIRAVLWGLFMLFSINLLVAVYQVIFSHSIGLTVLGESPIDKYSTGIALLRVSRFYVLRGYGFFAHPNILGAFALFGISFIDNFAPAFVKTENYRLIKFLRFVCFATIIVSFSKIVILVAFMYQVFRKLKVKFDVFALTILFMTVLIYLLPFLFIQINVQSFDLRGLQLSSALSYLLESFPQNLLGTGYMGWLFVTAKNPILLPTGSYFLQPLHNTFLLMFVEWGMFSIPFLLLFGKRLFRAVKGNLFQFGMVFLLVLGMFDHYFLTIPIGILIILTVVLNNKDIN